MSRLLRAVREEVDVHETAVYVRSLARGRCHGDRVRRRGRLDRAQSHRSLERCSSSDQQPRGEQQSDRADLRPLRTRHHARASAAGRGQNRRTRRPGTGRTRWQGQDTRGAAAREPAAWRLPGRSRARALNEATRTGHVHRQPADRSTWPVRVYRDFGTFRSPVANQRHR